MSDKHNPHGTHGHGQHSQDPMQNLWMAMTGASAGHHEETPGLNPDAANVGHEPDRFDARTIVGVPVVVAVTLVITYLIVQGAFAFVNGRASRQMGDEQFNARADRIGTTDAKPIVDKDGGVVQKPVTEPNLEYIRMVDNARKTADGNVVEDKPFLRSFKPLATGNSPEIYPEDLRAEVFVDPTTRKRSLVEPSWAVKDKVAVIPIDQMIELMTHDDKFKLKVSDKPAAVPSGTLGKARISTGGLTPPTPKPGDKKDDGHKH